MTHFPLSDSMFSPNISEVWKKMVVLYREPTSVLNAEKPDLKAVRRNTINTGIVHSLLRGKPSVAGA